METQDGPSGAWPWKLDEASREQKFGVKRGFVMDWAIW